MPKNIRKIDHKGESYISLDDIIDLLDKAKNIGDLKSMLVPKSGNKLSAFNKKLVQGLGYNPKQDLIGKKECELTLKDYKSLIGQTYIHNSGSHKILITDVKCISDIETNEYDVWCDYENLKNGIISLIKVNQLYKGYKLSAIDNL